MVFNLDNNFIKVFYLLDYEYTYKSVYLVSFVGFTGIVYLLSLCVKLLVCEL